MNQLIGSARRALAVLAATVALALAVLAGGGTATAAPAAPAAVPEVYSITSGSGPMMLDAYEHWLFGYLAFVGPPERNSSQRWSLFPQQDGTYILNQLSTGRVLDGSYHGGVNDWLAFTAPYQGSVAQKWRVQHIGGGFVTIQQVSSGRYLEAAITNPNVNYVYVRPWTGSNFQVWRLV